MLAPAERWIARVPAGLLAAVWLLMAALAWLPDASAQELVPVPPLSKRVTDFTDTLKPEQRAEIEELLADLEKRKGAQLAVLIVPGTAPESIAEYSLRVVEAWKLGRAKVQGEAVDDGVLLLVARNERKLRIEVGRGLEGAIPDAMAKRIIAETIAPRFREGDFAGGVREGVEEIIALIDGEQLPEPWHPDQSGDDAVGQWVFFIFVFLLLSVPIASMVGRLPASMVVGAGSGVAGVVLGIPMVMAVVIALGLFAATLLVNTLLAARSASRGGGSSIGRSTWSSGGSDWGIGSSSRGGSSSDSSSSDSGFSGGGGDFGGGGASGDW